jgi:hypothetical protein
MISALFWFQNLPKVTELTRGRAGIWKPFRSWIWTVPVAHKLGQFLSLHNKKCDIWAPTKILDTILRDFPLNNKLGK